MTNESRREKESVYALVKNNWLWHTLREPRVFILEREWTTRASASIAEIFTSLSMRVNSRMSVCLCERSARIHASPRLSHRADIRHETPVHPTLWVCRRCVFRDHYIPPPFMGKGISPLIQKTRRNTHSEVKEVLNCWTR